MRARMLAFLLFMLFLQPGGGLAGAIVTPPPPPLPPQAVFRIDFVSHARTDLPSSFPPKITLALVSDEAVVRILARARKEQPDLEPGTELELDPVATEVLTDLIRGVHRPYRLQLALPHIDPMQSDVTAEITIFRHQSVRDAIRAALPDLFTRGAIRSEVVVEELIRNAEHRAMAEGVRPLATTTGFGATGGLNVIAYAGDDAAVAVRRALNAVGRPAESDPEFPHLLEALARDARAQGTAFLLYNLPPTNDSSPDGTLEELEQALDRRFIPTDDATPIFVHSSTLPRSAGYQRDAPTLSLLAYEHAFAHRDDRDRVDELGSTSDNWLIRSSLAHGVPLTITSPPLLASFASGDHDRALGHPGPSSALWLGRLLAYRDYVRRIAEQDPGKVVGLVDATDVVVVGDSDEIIGTFKKMDADIVLHGDLVLLPAAHDETLKGFCRTRASVTHPTSTHPHKFLRFPHIYPSTGVMIGYAAPLRDMLDWILMEDGGENMRRRYDTWHPSEMRHAWDDRAGVAKYYEHHAKHGGVFGSRRVVVDAGQQLALNTRDTMVQAYQCVRESVPPHSLANGMRCEVRATGTRPPFYHGPGGVGSGRKTWLELVRKHEWKRPAESARRAWDTDPEILGVGGETQKKDTPQGLGTGFRGKDQKSQATHKIVAPELQFEEL